MQNKREHNGKQLEKKIDTRNSKENNVLSINLTEGFRERTGQKEPCTDDLHPSQSGTLHLLRNN